MRNSGGRTHRRLSKPATLHLFACVVVPVWVLLLAVEWRVYRKNETRCGRGRIGPTRSLLHRADEMPSAPVVNVGILVFRLVRRSCATMQPSSDVMIMVALLRHLVAPNEACTHREVVLKKERARSP